MITIKEVTEHASDYLAEILFFVDSLHAIGGDLPDIHNDVVRKCTHIIELYKVESVPSLSEAFIWECALHCALEKKFNDSVSYADMQVLISSTVGLENSAKLCASLDIDQKLVPEVMRIKMSRDAEMQRAYDIVKKYIPKCLNINTSEGDIEKMYDSARDLAKLANAEMQSEGLFGTQDDEKLAMIIVSIIHGLPVLEPAYRTINSGGLVVPVETMKSLHSQLFEFIANAGEDDGPIPPSNPSG